MFTTGFDEFVIEGEKITCTVDGFKCVAWTERDDDCTPPDQRFEGFWPSLDPNAAGYIGPKSKSTLAREMAWAKKVMQAWKNDEWDYCGVVVAIYRNGIRLAHPYDTALWGIERNYPVRRKTDRCNSYLTDTANELLPQALAAARKTLKELCECVDA